MPSPVRYIIHPGWVRSENDGDLRYITASRLISLYQINPRDPKILCVIDKYGTGFEISETPGDIHLYPRADDNYSLPAVSELPSSEAGK